MCDKSRSAAILHSIDIDTMKLHPRTFILIGVPRTGVDPEELAKQGELF